ncbi:hypothetical protein GCM10022268_02110 [Sphingomonas cynarae]|uniref:Uncharacterized protein n=1 Tax=Sphingomonas cynarae TaxID=930197 RepID=A0ABP7CR08_9SPHN
MHQRRGTKGSATTARAVAAMPPSRSARTPVGCDFRDFPCDFPRWQTPFAGVPPVKPDRARLDPPALEWDDIGLTQSVIASVAKQSSAGPGRPGLLRSDRNDEHPVQPDVIRF